MKRCAPSLSDDDEDHGADDDYNNKEETKYSRSFPRKASMRANSTSVLPTATDSLGRSVARSLANSGACLHETPRKTSDLFKIMKLLTSTLSKPMSVRSLIDLHKRSNLGFQIFSGKKLRLNA